MFPDISCDDIFRLETRRLWLRWLRASDAPAVAAICASPEVAQMTANIPYPYPAGEAERFILQSRAANAGGQALVLAVTLKNKARTLIGVVSAQAHDRHEVEIGFTIAPTHCGQGYATEAATVLIDVVFRLTEVRGVEATTRVGNIASTRILDKLGFAPLGPIEIDLPARGGAQPCLGFRLDRSKWGRTDQRTLPGMSQQNRPPT